MYSNDESDKAIRKRNYYVQTVIIPVAVSLAILSLVYWGAQTGYLNRIDMTVGYSLVPGAAITLFFYNKGKWLKMPDGSFCHLASIPRSRAVIEPVAYEVEFFMSKTAKFTYVVCGMILVAGMVWIAYEKTISVLLMVFGIGSGLLFCYVGVKGLLDKRPKLKLAKTGIWTNSLGFVEWKHVARTNVVEDDKGENKTMNLEIYLKGTAFAAANRPDEIIDLLQLKGRKEVEGMIDELRREYKERLPK